MHALPSAHSCNTPSIPRLPPGGHVHASPLRKEGAYGALRRPYVQLGVTRHHLRSGRMTGILGKSVILGKRYEFIVILIVILDLKWNHCAGDFPPPSMANRPPWAALSRAARDTKMKSYKFILLIVTRKVPLLASATVSSQRHFRFWTYLQSGPIEFNLLKKLICIQNDYQPYYSEKSYDGNVVPTRVEFVMRSKFRSDLPQCILVIWVTVWVYLLEL
jgi:hypothetical protein